MRSYNSYIVAENLYTTSGCHPTRCTEFEKSGDPEKYLSDLIQVVKDNPDKIVAIGELGLGMTNTFTLINKIQTRF